MHHKTRGDTSDDIEGLFDTKNCNRHNNITYLDECKNISEEVST